MTTFFVEPKVVTLRETEISISPLAVRNISKAAKCAAPLIASFSGGVDPEVILQYGDEVIELCALCSNQTTEFVGSLNSAELLVLLTTIVEVNGNFFIQSITPQAMIMADTVKKLTAQGQQKVGKKA